MAAESTAPSWQYANNDFSFAQDAPTRIPRGWERAPQPSHLARHKGRQVWKRLELTRAKDDAENLDLSEVDEQRNPLRDVSTNTPRPIKRLRAEDGLFTQDNGEDGGFSNYFTTLHDRTIGTPRRKHTSKDTRKAEEATQKAASPDNSKCTEEREGADKVESKIETSRKCSDVVVVKVKIEEDVLQALASPAQENVRGFLHSATGLPLAIRTEEKVPISQLSSLGEEKFLLDKRVDANAPKGPRNAAPVRHFSSELKTTSLPHEGVEATATLPVSTLQKIVALEPDAAAAEIAVGLDIKTPCSRAGKNSTIPTSTVGIESPHNSQSPQIGVTLLRRESLRSRTSPRKKGSAQKNKSPQKRHGLKKRDTLQEREILQQFNAIASPNQVFNPGNFTNHGEESSPRKLSPIQDTIVIENARRIGMSREVFEDQSMPEIDNDTQESDVVSGTKIKDSQDVARAIKTISGCQKSSDKEASAGLNVAPPSPVANELVDQATEGVIESEVDEATQTAAKDSEKAELPSRQTRSGARISDDTSVLKDFLDRAQAKKAAKSVPSLSAGIPKLQDSPTRRSPRKALEPYYGQNLSPQKCRKSVKGPSTPPQKPVVEEVDSSDEHEFIHEPASFRRSSRTRLPAPTKTPLGAPSFIPVRRGDGSDQVVLQKSHAQETAIATRANTRRNKGQSKPPALALQDLPAGSPMKMTAKERVDQAKTVVWAEKLASFWESKDAPEEPEEQRPKVRRMRGLGAVNGTPAKKSTAVVPSSNGTPAPKRRGKTK